MTEKLGINEGLVRAIQVMYRDVISEERVDNEYSEEFEGTRRSSPRTGAPPPSPHTLLVQSLPGNNREI